MSEPIAIETLPAQPVCEVFDQTHFWKIAKVLAEGYAKVDQQIAAAGATAKGMPYARYLEIDWSTATNGGFRQFLEFLFKKQKMAIGKFLENTGGTEGFGSQIPAGRFVSTIHRGPYHKVGDTYARIVAWAEEEGLQLGNYSIENYIDDPTEMEMAEVRTKVFVPVTV